MAKAKEESNNDCSGIYHHYMIICPSGLERFTLNIISNEITIKNYVCHEIKILNNTCCDETQNTKIEGYKQQLFTQLQKKKDKQRIKRNKVASSCTKSCEKQQHHHKQQQITDTSCHHEDENNHDDNDKHELSEKEVHGSIKIKEHDHEREICIGYHKDETIISHPGGLEGKQLIAFKTNAPPKIVANIRPAGCGPLLAVVLNSSDVECEDTKNSHVFALDKSLDDSVTSFASLMSKVGSVNYERSFAAALDLWYQHVKDVWLQSKDIHDFHLKKRETNELQLDIEDLRKSLVGKMNGSEVCRYRLSSMRSFTREYSYKRMDIIPHLAKYIIPSEIQIKDYSGDCDDSSNGNKSLTLTVNLQHYDWEVVLFSYEDIFSIAITLCPYQYLGARSFSCGKITPDIASPYITGDISNTIVRLRPSIASLLCHISQIEKGDIIVDPCAGVGTVPIEASFLGGQMSCFGIGGDIAIGLDHIITDYYKRARNHQRSQCYSGGCDMMSWDASSIPLRDSTVDCIISDLPFGIKCMSSKRLQMFLPLLFSSCARILRRKTGRMTLLCGSSYKRVLDAILEQRNHDSSYDIDALFQVTSVFPTNIGGLSAWIIQAVRNDNDPFPLKNHHARHRKMATGREQQQRQGTKKRIQS